MHGQTGTWQERVIDFTIFNTAFVSGAVMLGCACGAYFCIKYLWRRHIKDLLNQLTMKAQVYYYLALRNSISKLIQPIQRIHAKWSSKNWGLMMAKWRKGHLANAFYETIHREIAEGRLSKQQGKQLQAQMAKFFGLDDLARIKTHKEAILHKLALNKLHEIGPKVNQDSGLGGTKPCWGDEPQPYGPPIETLGGKFLNRKKVA